MDKRGLSGQDSGTAVLSISGMTCDGCVNTVTRILSRVPGVTGANVDFESDRATVMGNARLQDLVAAMQAAGYGAQPA
ncbi:MAG: heavy-metal-associated domain-containing protein [Stellaceae bacterium]